MPATSMMLFDFSDPTRTSTHEVSASRYAPPGQPGVRTPHLDEAPSAVDPSDTERWLENVRRASDDSGVAAFVVHELPRLRLQAERAVSVDDVEALRSVTSRIDSMVKSHGDFLAMWTDLPGNGPEGERASALVRQIMNGQYRYEWGVKTPTGVKTVAGLEDEESEEGKTRRARRLTRDPDLQAIGVTEDTARAMIDPSDPRYSLYGRFRALTATAVDRPNDLRDVRARDQQREFLGAVQRLEQTRGSSFGSDLAGFVSAFDNTMNADGFMSGESVLNAAADAYLGRRDNSSPLDFMQRFSDFSKAVQQAVQPPQEVQSGEKGKQFQERMSVHEAQSLTASFFKAAAKAGMQDDLLSTSIYRDSLVSAATMTRRLRDLYGIDLRKGSSGTSDAVARLALSRLGVPGVDDGSLARQVDAVTSRLALLASEPTRKMLQLKQGQRGETVGELVDAANPYSGVELQLVRDVGQAFWDTVARNRGDISRALDEIEDPNSRGRQDIGLAMATVLSARLGHGELAYEVAGDLIPNLTGTGEGPRMSIEESLRLHGRMIQDFDTGSATPPGVKLSSSSGYDDSDIGLLAQGKLLASEQGNDGLRAAQKDLAVAIQDVKRAGSDKEAYRRYSESVGKLYASVTGDNDPVVTSGDLVMYATDRKTDVSPDVVKRYVSQVSDADGSRVDRAEALAKLLIIGASGSEFIEKGPVSTTVGPGVFFTSSRNDRDLWPSVQVAARSLGVVLPDDVSQVAKSGYGPELQKLYTMVPEFAESKLVKSGYLNMVASVDGKPAFRLDDKNMLRVQQEATYADAMKNDGRDDPSLDDVAIAARRALASFENETTAVGSAAADVRRGLVSQGLTGDALALAEGTASERLVDAYRRGGAVAVEREKRALLSRRMYFLPRWRQMQPAQKGAAPLVQMDPNDVVATELLTPEEWEAAKRRDADGYRAVMHAEVPSDVYESLQVTGPGIYRDKVDQMKIAVLNGMKERQKVQAQAEVRGD